MLHVSADLLDKLRCATCEGYLSSSPVVVKDDRQICGKCYRILSKGDRRLCARQLSFELVAEYVRFPCRYNINGCDHKYLWNGENGHEKECPYRFPQYYESPKSTTTTRHLKCESEDVKADLKYEMRENRHYSSIAYNLTINGNYGKTLSIHNPFSESGEQNDIYVNLEGVLMMKTVPEIMYSNIKVKPREEHHYESIEEFEKTCKHYNKSYGSKCDHSLDQSCQRLCKNSEMGCTEQLLPTTNHLHEKSCEYNRLLCPIQKCNFSNVLKELKSHLHKDHWNDVVTNNELKRQFSNKDEVVVFCCFDNIFKCTYYPYESYVEFFVSYIGAVDSSVKFWYEVSTGQLKEKGKCSTVFDAMLTKGVVFDKAALNVDCENDFKVNFDIVLKQM